MNNLNIIKKMLPDTMIHNIYCYGSRVYKTNKPTSDYDYIIVADGVKDHNQIDSYSKDISLHTYTPNTFQNLINDHKISALECLFLPEDYKIVNNLDFKFNLNKALLRKEISQKSNHSWVKAKKKLEIEKDYYIGLKSLFHSFRIVDFGIQIAKDKKITNYSSNFCLELWNEILKYYIDEKNVDWFFYTEKFRYRHNQILTEFRKYAEKA